MKRAPSRSKSPVKKAGARAPSKVSRQERLVKMVSYQQWTVTQVEEMAKAGKVAGLEAVVLAGQGHLLDGLGKVWNEEVRAFLKKAPALRREVEEVVGLVLQGNTEAVAALTDPRLLFARDTVGVAPILRAARLANLDMVNLILGKLPQAVKTTDPEGRTPLHWAYRCEDGLGRERVVGLLQSKGADRGAKDSSGNSPDFYLENDFPAAKEKEKAKAEPAETSEEAASSEEKEGNDNDKEEKVIQVCFHFSNSSKV